MNASVQMAPSNPAFYRLIWEWGSKRRLMARLTFAICGLIGALYALSPSRNTFDYPVGVLSAQLVLHGARPYVDAGVMYGPLGHYLGAAAVALPGKVLPRAIAA